MLRRFWDIVNHKRVHRIYRALGLQIRARRKRGVRYLRGNDIVPATRPNERWSIDFVHDTLSTRRRFRILTVIDDFSRECIAAEIAFSFPSLRVICVLDQIARARSLPDTLKPDNGGEFTSDEMLRWSAKNNIDLHFIEPGRPMQKAA